MAAGAVNPCNQQCAIGAKDTRRDDKQLAPRATSQVTAEAYRIYLSIYILIYLYNTHTYYTCTLISLRDYFNCSFIILFPACAEKSPNIKS